jgi:hypothetical protein
MLPLSYLGLGVAALNIDESSRLPTSNEGFCGPALFGYYRTVLYSLSYKGKNS